jgi:HlyD family secretion protein
MNSWLKQAVAAILFLVFVGAVYRWHRRSENVATVSFRTMPVSRGDLSVTVDATGTLVPEEVVDIGAQVAGQIVAFGTDTAGKPIDYGSRVEQGTILARIDEALAQADVAQSEAQVASARAGVRRAEADLEQLRAKFRQATRDWERAKIMRASEVLTQSDYDGYQSAYEMAKANVGVGEAAILEAQASVTLAETSLWRANRNLGYCTIASPVRGVIIDRRVNIGQTVVASLEAPSLFLIAKDLGRMQILAAVNEADVARIQPGQAVAFTVDALPDETFQGDVVKVRFNASMTQNVVTYTVEIATDNPDGRLLPYLTANVKIEVESRKDVLMAPAAALHWTPTINQVAPEFRDGQTGSVGVQPTIPAPGQQEANESKRQGGWVYAVQGKYVRPMSVKIGIGNGASTEVSGPGVAEGLAIVVGAETVSATSAETSNPFTPKMPAPPKGGGRPPL